MRKSQKLLLSTIVVGVMGSLVALGVFGLFSATTQNTGNEISSGTVVLSDNDGGSAQINITNAKPGDTWTRCIKVTYNGTIPADVHFYVTGGGGPLFPHVQIVSWQGSQTAATFPSCTEFTPDGTIGNGVPAEGPPAEGLPTGSYETGVAVVPFGQTVWNQGDSLVFKTVFTLDANAPELAQGSTTGNWTLNWEARNH